jgi:hypothetical protein
LQADSTPMGAVNLNNREKHRVVFERLLSQTEKPHLIHAIKLLVRWPRGAYRRG